MNRIIRVVIITVVMGALWGIGLESRALAVTEAELIAAIKAGDVATVQKFHASGQKLSPMGRRDEDIALWSHLQARGPGYQEIALQYMQRDPMLGEFFLVMAASGDLDFAGVLLKRGVSANAKEDGGGASALTRAVEAGNIKMVRLLLEHGADPDEGVGNDMVGYFTPMELAKDPAIQELLVSRGSKDIRGDQKLLDAVAADDLPAVQQLLAGGADINFISGTMENAATPLTKALDANHAKMALYLIGQGADVTFSPASSGIVVTMLMRAAKTGNADVVEAVINKGGSKGMPPHFAGPFINDSTRPKLAGLILADVLIASGGIELLEETLPEVALSRLSKAQLRIIRNTILARHGYRFKSTSLTTHFQQFFWYQEATANAPDNDVVNTRLTDQDKENLALVRKLEKVAQ